MSLGPVPLARRFRVRVLPWACLVSASAAGFACSDPAAPSDEQAPHWQVVLEELPGALISVSGTAPDDVWFAGSAPDDGSGALVLHYDGDRFERITSGVESDLWWVHAVAPNQVYFGGADGVIVYYDGDRFERMQTPGTDTVFGIWAADVGTADTAKADTAKAWAVGGDPARDDRAFVWTLDERGAWVVADAPDLAVSSYFKVWGADEDDVRIVGADGVILHSEGQSFVSADSPAEYSLTTIHRAADGTYAAVGGFGDGIILEDTGAGWEDRTPAQPPKQLYGVWLGTADGYAVGANGTILRRGSEGWAEVATGLAVTLDLHATWIDARGSVWAVGGDLVSSPKTSGLVLHFGPDAPSSAGALLP